MSPGPNGEVSLAGGCSMSPCTPTVLMCTTRETPAPDAAMIEPGRTLDIHRAKLLLGEHDLPEDRCEVIHHRHVAQRPRE